MIARRHHYIPQFYLKGFAVVRRKTHRLVVFDCNSCTTFDAPTKTVAMARDFNRVEIDGRPPDVVEKAMAGLESELASALQRIIAARSIRHETDRAYLFNLIALLALRNPGQRERWRAFREQVAKRMMDLATATPQRWASQVAQAKAAGHIRKDADINYAKVRKMVVDDEYSIELSTGEHIGKEISSIKTILPYIFNRKWALLKCHDNSAGFVTSDHPVCLMWSDPARRSPVGFKLGGTEIVFPICNRLAVVGAFEIEEDEIDATEDMVASVNGTLIGFAERHVYARDHNFRYMSSLGQAKKGSRLTSDLRRARQRRSRTD